MSEEAPRIGITGADGFLGWHLACALTAQGRVFSGAGRALMADEERAAAFASGCDVIVHLAGVNRGTDDQVRGGNAQAARQLVAALRRSGGSPAIVFASSTHVEGDSAYGAGKREAAEILGEWAAAAGGQLSTLVLPHVFGELGRPFYNSVTATFCHQLRSGQQPRIISDGQLELVHAQDLCDTIIQAVEAAPGRMPRATATVTRVPGRQLQVSELLQRLQAMLPLVDALLVPATTDPFERALFNTLRSYAPDGRQASSSPAFADPRGRLHELLRVGSGGQAFVSWTNPGFTRGGHFHRRKFERFVVLAGVGRVRLRRVCADDTTAVVLDASEGPVWLDMPTLHAHDITNIGDTQLLTLFWADEFYDSAHPDTYTHAVVPQSTGG